ncbi:hypothetical protein [Pantoea sp. KPR_PJ]|uniref:hypothetical protein n=1 Tax=Pantoea sp. KPR_PJ TaxID=2738375 RepID=UPI00352758B5
MRYYTTGMIFPLRKYQRYIYHAEMMTLRKCAILQRSMHHIYSVTGAVLNSAGAGVQGEQLIITFRQLVQLLVSPVRPGFPRRDAKPRRPGFLAQSCYYLRQPEKSCSISAESCTTAAGGAGVYFLT